MYAIRSYYELAPAHLQKHQDADEHGDRGSMRDGIQQVAGELQPFFTLEYPQQTFRQGFDVGQAAAGDPDQLRITSYNVCYTKLLRVAYLRQAGMADDALIRHIEFP